MPLSMKSNFKTIQEVKSEYSTHSFTEYVSTRTGLRIVVVDQMGPKVLGYFTAATEIFDDSGSPHTLEHLCFMGSKNYPYKGLLDKIATRAYSNTNAWTATDHTAYTLDSAGYAAFAQILPIYLEHVILPTLTEAGCYTEVHHIDGTGHDAGVVYSEMQGVQNQGPELMDLRSRRIMYPEGVGFRYETGGMMEHLRVLTPDRIRRFHRDMYQPKNLCIIIVGEIDHKDLLSILDSFEDSILNDIPDVNALFKRPWVDSPQPGSLEKSVIETVEFPEEDEEIGEILIRYFGPHCEDVVNYTATNVLLSYLAGSSASVLENVLVEQEHLASAVYYSQTPRPSSVIDFTLSGVETNRLAEVEMRFLEVVQFTASNELDMAYMKDCIDREQRQQMYQAENSQSWFASSIISTFLFSKERDFKYLSSMREFDELQKWSGSQWRKFLRSWIADNAHISILGKPSIALSEKLKKDEEQRVAIQIKNLGDDGLRELKSKIEDANKENNRPIPQDLLSRFKVPATDTIHFISTVPARSGKARDLGVPQNHIQKIIEQDDPALPVFIHFEHIPSNFVSVNVLICTSQVPIALRPLLSVYIENFFTSPVVIDGIRTEFEEVVKQLHRDTVGYEMSSGASLGNTEILIITLQTETSKYATAIKWLRDLLWHIVFDVARIESTIAKLLADVPEEKRSGSDMAYAASDMVNSAPGSIVRAMGTLVKAVYLKRLKRLLKSDPETVLQQFEEIRKAICQTSNFRILVTGSVEKVQRPVASWETFADGKDFSKAPMPLDSRVERFSDAGSNPGKLAYIIPVSAIDSSYALAVAKGPNDSKDPRTAALMVSISYLDAVEGPLWTAVRGTGLAYGTSFRRRTGSLEYSVYSSPDAHKAFAASRKVVEEFVSGASSFDPLALEGAISSIVSSLASQQATMAEAAQDKFVLQVVKDLPRDWNDILLEKVRNVSIDEIKQTMSDLLLPLFEPSKTNLFVTCAPIMEKNLLDGFRTMGFAPEVQPLSFFQDDYGLTVEGEEGREDDDDNEDDDALSEEEETGKGEEEGDGGTDEKME